MLFAGSSLAWGQPWTYNFGTTTGSFSTPNTVNTTLLPNPTSGNTLVRVGVRGGSLNLENQSISFGSLSYLRAVAATSTSYNFAKLSGFSSPTALTYLKFKVLLGTSTGANTAASGNWHFVMGNGTSFSTSNSPVFEDYVAGLKWTFGASGAITTAPIVSGEYSGTVTGFSQGSSINVEIYINNSANSSSYYRTEDATTYTLASREIDLWVSGTRKQTGFSVNSTGPASGTAINAFMFYGGSSTTNEANLFVDDFEYSNTLPVNSTPTVVAPTFDPAGGNYLTTQNVSLTTTTDGATIHYTTNGDEPTETSATYSSPISISTTTTIKAKAFKAGMDASAVASATYSFPTNVTDIATLRTQTTGTTRYKLTGQAALTYQSTAGKVKYIQDATGAIILTDPSGIITTTYDLYDGITGIVGTLSTANNMLQFTPVADPGAATATGLTVIPVEVTLANLTTDYQAKLVKVNNVSIAATGNFAVSTNYTISDPTSSTGVLRTNYTDLNYITTAIPTIAQDITGVVVQYNTAIQLVPRSTSDFVNSPVAVTFNVDMNGTSGYTDVYVAGSFNSWSPTASKMTTSGGNIYTFTTARTINIGDVIEFKIVKDGTTWENDPNRSYTAIAGSNTVNVYWNATTLPQLDWVNLQYPATAIISTGSSLNVYAQVYEDGLTQAAGQGANVSAWIGYSTSDTNPNTWTNWVAATFNKQDGNNDEYIATIGSALAGGKYYYASRFKYGLNDYVYGGYSTNPNGGFWNGTTNVSGVLTVIANEPTAHVTNPAATPNSSTEITVTWTDATANGYLIKGSAVSYDDIAAPVDGVAETNSTLVRNVTSGTQTYKFTGLTAETTYYFKIFPYNGSGEQIDYKVDGTVPQATAATYKAPTVLQSGDIAILQVNTSTTDRFSFVTFVDLNPGTVINFTDNGFTSATTVRTGEGSLIYTAPAFVPAGTVVSWYDGMAITGTGWSAKILNFTLTDGDQLFAYQGTWDNSQTLIYGINLDAWITTGVGSTTTSYLPSSLTDNVNAFCFASKKYNAYYTNITSGTVNALKSLITYNTNWTTLSTDQGAKSWTFTLGNSTTLDANTSVYNLTIATGETLTINPAKQLTISGAATNNGTIIIQSDASGTGTIVGNVSGAATVQQYLPGDGRQWWYLSSPVTGATSNVFAPTTSTNKIGVYVEDYLSDGNEATTSPYYTNPYAAGSSTPLSVGKGYVVKLSATTGGTYTFEGTLNNGDYTLTPTRTGVTAGKRGFNLVGNPYPSYLNWNAAYADAATSNVSNAIWYRTYSGGQMTFHTYADADRVPEITTGIIPPAQAFWIRVNADGSNGTITFKNAHRSHAGATANPLKAPKANDRPRVRLQISNGVNADEALIVAKSYASNGIDSYDIEKMSNDNVDVPEIYTLLNNQDMVINSFNSFVAGQEIALGMRPGKAGDFTINATQFENIPSDIKVILKDKFTGAETELSENASYSFNADGNEANQRFSLLFRAPGSVTGIDNAGNQTLFVYAQPSEIVVNGEELKGSNITVYTATGQSVMQVVAAGNREVLNGNFAPGVYFVKVNNTVKKVSVK